MAEPMVKIDEEIHEKIKQLVQDNKKDYPTIQFYVHRALKNQLRIDLMGIKEQEQE